MTRSDYTCVIRNRGSWAHMGPLFFENMPCAHLRAREIVESILLSISMFFLGYFRHLLSLNDILKFEIDFTEYWR